MEADTLFLRAWPDNFYAITMKFPFHTKICGVTTVDDAIMVAGSGAEAIGLNFYRAGKRFIEPEIAKTIVAAMAATHVDMVSVGVFVNETSADILNIVQTVGLMTVQLHGDESPKIVLELNQRGKSAGLEFDIIRAIRTLPHSAATAMDRDSVNHEVQTWVEAGVAAVLVDAATPGQFGGTGKQVDWHGVAKIQSPVPVLLAGGLTPENVANAVATARPFGVDVASGVEDSPGKKNREKTLAFVAAAKDL